MSATRPHEAVLLDAIERLIEQTIASLGEVTDDCRLEVLEAVASRVGGIDLQTYRATFDQVHYTIDVGDLLPIADRIILEMMRTGIPCPMALASLARPQLDDGERRRTGVYYTDFRLAHYVANHIEYPRPRQVFTVLDPAAGTGALLAAVVMASCGANRSRATSLIREGVCAADLSAAALRGTRLVLASLTSDVTAIAEASTRMRCHDSLLVGATPWMDVAPNGFELVVGNPPWGKVKLSRHEYLQAQGVVRHYGADYTSKMLDTGASLQAERLGLADYADRLTSLYPLQGTGEPDYYKAFVELATTLTKELGQIGLVVPSGLIRSQGTERLRRYLLQRSSKCAITVFENRARFFAIDTRVKFLVVHATIAAQPRREPLVLRHGVGTHDGIAKFGSVMIGRRALAATRQDLTVPEVRSRTEWRIFREMTSYGQRLGDRDGSWCPRIVREVDMTRERNLFHSEPTQETVPLAEGRMVHQFRFGAKEYVSGTGRQALWKTRPMGQSKIVPQFWVHRDDLPTSAIDRVDQLRVGFCDITGQTNERSMLAALVPNGVVCGNKVPTVVFRGDSELYKAHLFLAVANSLPFDWLLRRVLTTTVNYFLLLGLSFPRIQINGLSARRLIELSRHLTSADSGRAAVDLWQVAEWRAEIDIRVLLAYGIDTLMLPIILADFPLLDRRQPPLPGEQRSTITRDLLLLRAGVSVDAPELEDRVRTAQRMGAIPYVSSEFAGTTYASQWKVSNG